MRKYAIMFLFSTGMLILHIPLIVGFLSGYLSEAFRYPLAASIIPLLAMAGYSKQKLWDAGVFGQSIREWLKMKD